MVGPIDGIFDADAVDRLANNTADYADAAHDLAQKKAKLAAHAVDHDSGELGDSEATPEEGQRRKSSSRTTVGQAWDNSKHKFFDGARTFAGFSILLTGISLLVTGGFSIFSAESISVASKLVPAIAAVITATFTGALWIGGGEFKKQYQSINEKETRLGKAFDGIDKARERFGSKGRTAHEPQRDSELGVLAGSLSSTLGTTAFLMEVPTEMLDAPQTSQAVQGILAQGPRGAANAALAQRSELAELSQAERVSQSRDANAELTV